MLERPSTVLDGRLVNTACLSVGGTTWCLVPYESSPNQAMCIHAIYLCTSVRRAECIVQLVYDLCVLYNFCTMSACTIQLLYKFCVCFTTSVQCLYVPYNFCTSFACTVQLLYNVCVYCTTSVRTCTLYMCIPHCMVDYMYIHCL